MCHDLLFSLLSSSTMLFPALCWLVSAGPSSDLTNLCSKLPIIGRVPLPAPTVVTEVNAVGWSLICPGLGSSSSSTRPSALASNASGFPGPAVLRASGEGGGLRDLDRRASSWRKGMGENRGVDGTDWPVRPIVSTLRTGGSVSVSDKGGKLSHVEVTKRDLSTARRYFPTVL